jgi:exodeoxyribonuclease VII large subunit
MRMEEEPGMAGLWEVVFGFFDAAMNYYTGMISSPQTRQVYSVSELAELLRGLLEDALPALWVEGELSNFRNPSGHWYFTLKDERAQIRCAMFKGKNYLIKPLPKDGDHVLVRAKVGFYEGRGELQLVVEHLEPAGEGALLRAFEELKARLAAEGLFDEKLKRPIPVVPRGIGIVTSPTGAALQDILTTLRRRFPLGSVYVYPVPVQGAAACPAICGALTDLPQRAPVDVIILARGGGSLEDLSCFNHESVARAIRACALPVVTGIGHEIDFTIADFAADLRAPTPTGAAERVSPDLAEWREHVGELEYGLADAMRVRFEARGDALDELRQRLERAHPGRRLQQFLQRLDELWERLAHGGPVAVARRRERLQTQALLLQSFSPRAILERGYAIAQTPDGHVIRDAAELAPGDALDVVLARGSVGTRVTEKKR